MTELDGLKHIVQDDTKVVAVILAGQSNKGNELLPQEARQKKIENELQRDIELFQNKMHDGLKTCILPLEHCTDLPLSMADVIAELQKCFQPITNPKALADFGKNVFLGHSWKDQLGISDNCMQTLYQGARSLFESKDYVQAENAFFAICTIDPSQFAYWIGRGHSCYQNEHFQDALNAYAMASGFEPENIWPYIWIANCLEAEKDYTSAAKALQEALALLQSLTPKNRGMIHSLEERLKKIHTHKT